jgi:hypothetical protein
MEQILSFLDLGGFRFLIKYFFMPGIFVLDNLTYESGCVRINFKSLFHILSATYMKFFQQLLLLL